MTDQEQSIRLQIVALVQSELDGGADPEAAYASVRDTIKRRDRIQEVWEAVGARCVSDIYRSHAASDRSCIRAGVVAWTQPGKRKARATEDVNAFGDKLFGIAEMVDGAYKAFGDCTAEDCDWLAENRAKAARSHERAAEGYGRFARAIRRAGVKTVRQAFKGRIAAAIRLYRGIAAKEDE